MEVIFLDSAYRMTRIVDAFTSLIWNDSYYGYGDFELRFPMDTNSLAGIREGWYASIKESKKYMVVEGIEIKTSVSDGNYAIITGRSQESILDRRILIDHTILTGNFQNGILRLLNSNVISPTDTNRKINEIMFRRSNDPNITSLTIDAEYEVGDNLYDVINELCVEKKVGFRIVPESTGQMIFELYKGLDRTYAQEANPWIVFSPKFENIQETDMIIDTSELKNVMIIESTYSRQEETAEGETETIETTLHVEVGNGTGLDRREIYGNSNTKPDSVDKEAFGTAEDRVDRMDFCTWEPVFFDREAYNKAMEEYNARCEALYVPRQGPIVKDVWVEYKPGDPGYLGPDQGVSEGDPARVNGYWALEVIHGTTPEQYAANNANYFEYAENAMPNESAFMKYDWVLTDTVGYREALQNAQAEIDAEYAAAIADAEAVAMQIMTASGMVSLAPHMIISSFDGEVDSNVQAIFGRDYYLGDEVQIVNEFHFQAITRVVGMVISEEEGSGIVMYPTFKSDDKAVFNL